MVVGSSHHSSSRGEGGTLLTDREPAAGGIERTEARCLRVGDRLGELSAAVELAQTPDGRELVDLRRPTDRQLEVFRSPSGGARDARVVHKRDSEIERTPRVVDELVFGDQV